MSGTKINVLKLLVVGVAVALGSCNSTSLDNGSSADTVLEVFNIPAVPPITATRDEDSGICTFTVTNMTVTLRNQPKSELAGTSPFNDILIDTVEVAYAWDNIGLTAPPDRTMNIGGTVPAAGTLAVSFPPIFLGDLFLDNYEGHCANLTMLFRGRTVAGDAVSARGLGAVLCVSTCPP